MHGYQGWKYPRFEDFEYTSWLPDDDSMAWLGNGNIVAELTGVGDTTEYMDYTDVSKVLPVQTEDYPHPQILAAGEMNGEASKKENGSSEESVMGGKEAPLLPPAIPGNEGTVLVVSQKPRRSMFG
jgi:hypothetical protein